MPFVMVDWVSTWEHGMHEKGTGALNFGQKGRWCSLIRAESGFRFDEMLTMCWGTMTVREKASYAYQKPFGVGSITAFLIGAPGSFNVASIISTQNLGIGELELLFNPRNQKYPYGSISYQGQFGSHYQSHQVLGTVGMNF